MALSDSDFEIPLWPASPPGSEHWTHQEQESYLPFSYDAQPTLLPLPFDIQLARNIARPTLTAYLPPPSTATGTSVIICPGGAFHFLAIELEGSEVARYLSAHGIAAFLLKYRVLPTAQLEEDFIQQLQTHFNDFPLLMSLMQQMEPLAKVDGQQAIRIVRQHAAEWGIVSERIGMLGFSSGGVVTLGAATDYNTESRPHFAALIYPAPSAKKVVVPPDAPALFLLAANDDPVSASTILPLYTAWREANRSVEMHLYVQGGHGFGMKKRGLPTDHWLERFIDWLQVLPL